VLRLTTFGGLSIDGDPAPAGDVRPRRLALLAILAAAGAKGISREQVLSILWSESEPERARHSLSQTLYSLRRDLGVEVVLVTPNLRLDPSKITSDVNDFRIAAGEKDWDGAAELFTAPFLAGFYLSDAPDFERWADEERSLLTHEGIRALESAAAQADADGRTGQALESRRRLSKLDPLNGRFAFSYIEALAKAGDRAKALVHAQSHIDQVRRELEVEPDAAVLQLLEGLRDPVASVPNVRTPTSSPPGFRLQSAPQPIAFAPPISTRSSLAARAPESTRRRAYLFLAGSAALIVGTALVTQMLRTSAAASTGDDSGSRSRSALAERLYTDGLRAFYQFDAEEAGRLFDAAIKEDSSFAMANYFAWRSEVAINGPRQDLFAARARTLAPHASERDRMLIIAHLNASRLDLSAIAATESLVTRFPNDPDALIRAAEVTNELPRAVALLDRAIAVDSAAAKETSAICRACDAFNALAARYNWADSSEGVEETLDRWSALRPADPQPWMVRADYLIGLGRRRDADAAHRRADSLGASHGDTIEASLIRTLRTDDLDSAMTLCNRALSVVDPDKFLQYRWLCTIGLRMQGRDRDALRLSQESRTPGSDAVRRGVPPDLVHGAILDMEMGRPEAAANEFARMAADATHSGQTEGLKARAVAWELTLSGTAAALQDDTVRIRSLVDSVELIGHRSLFARDPLLHHYLRGLLLARAQQHEGAVREFRAAISSPSQGFTRINYEIGKNLLALNRASEAIPIVRASLHGGVEGSGLYLTRTETHELLAQLFDAAGRRDSAAVHYAVVERAWRSADPMLKPRYDAARQWLLRTGRSSR
jgi:DNA-binding SARP family transcriptional activator/tetratricopeptide (TPR) repeat protein